MKTYLCLKFHHIAVDNDMCDAVSELDNKSTKFCQPGLPKSHLQGEYFTFGPNWLWCCDGHDKFCNFGIEIYAGVDAYS